MTDAELYSEVTSIIEHEIAAGRTIRAEWLTHAVIQERPLPVFEDGEWYRFCAYGHVRSAVRLALRRYQPSEEVDAQILLPGMNGLQRAYLVKRNGEQVVVPIESLGGAEIDSKIAELKAMAEGCLEHARELQRYRDRKFPAVAG